MGIFKKDTAREGGLPPPFLSLLFFVMASNPFQEFDRYYIQAEVDERWKRTHPEPINNNNSLLYDLTGLLLTGAIICAGYKILFQDKEK